MPHRTLFTIGHSTRTWAEFVAILKVWEIAELVDVRTVPRSRAFPHFSKDQMARALPTAGVAYSHMAGLGGLRHSKKDSTNTGWRNASFRGYADYMQSEEFAKGIDELNRRRKMRRVCIMCSEAVWWRCHRRMIADAETARGIPVKHIMSETNARPHEMTEFAVARKGRGREPVITYPEPADASAARRANRG
jgi:uncharacterized protein (DUF488 family)